MPRLTSDAAPLSPYRVVWELMQAVDRTRTVVTHDAGHPRDQIVPFYETHRARAATSAGASRPSSAPGFGLAMGARLARPDWLAVNIMGDAAFGMVGMDFETAVRCRDPDPHDRDEQRPHGRLRRVDAGRRRRATRRTAWAATTRPSRRRSAATPSGSASPRSCGAALERCDRQRSPIGPRGAARGDDPRGARAGARLRAARAPRRVVRLAAPRGVDVVRGGRASPAARPRGSCAAMPSRMRLVHLDHAAGARAAPARGCGAAPRPASRRSSRAARRNSSLWVAAAMARWNARSIWTLVSRSSSTRSRTATMVSSIAAMSSAVARSAASPAAATSSTRRTSSTLRVVEHAALDEVAHRLARRSPRRRPRCARRCRSRTSSRPLALQRPDRLADDGARDAELVSQLALRRKRVARLELVRGDRLEDRLGDLVRQARLAVDRLENCGEFAVDLGVDGPNLAGCRKPDVG